MPIAPFLALTRAEMEKQEEYPKKTAWLGCHFSPSGRSLSNLPPDLPPGSLLIIDDANPIQGHDPAEIIQQTSALIKELDCAGVLLDFQRPNQEEAPGMVQALVKALPCPVAASSLYAAGLECPVFLPPVPPGTLLKEALWPNRECWLELAMNAEIITLTEQGAAAAPLEDIPADGFSDESLHCHYSLELADHQAIWKLWRTRQDLEGLLEEARQLGVTTAVGLWQEFRH